ncbi:thioredoxin Y1, chloroplastic-like [Impatiens glandulifera]|uniref:thioredoxin Y1, chloroplastic-like n=1 Tax=Impatiens glandulifera TaxID=253017 RepID=UPI001FB19A30|nr:thioredoxin Y1, chloroplastic-like [Impatiens glandulifera]
MAISVAAAATSSVRSDYSTCFFSPKLHHFSSLQLPRLHIGGNRGGFSSSSRPRTLSVVVEAKKQTFSNLDELLANSDKPVLVDFYATWCGPCQFMVPILEQVSATLKDKIQVVKIDTEKYPSIADKYKIEALPTFILFQKGQPQDRFEGALTANQLIERIDEALEVKE